MIDLYGNLVHKWTTPSTSNYVITELAWPLLWEDGNLVTDCYNKLTGGSGLISEPIVRGARQFDSICVFDWNGNVVETSADSLYDVNYAPHHDWKKIWNKALGEYTWLALTWQAYTAADAVALGADPKWDVGSTGYKNGWAPDGLVETDADGNLIWRWSFADHLVQNYDPTKTGSFTDGYGYINPGATYGEAVDYPGKMDINMTNDNFKGPSPDWNHCNSIDYNPALGHIILTAKDMSEVYIIAHDGTFVSPTDFEANWAAARGVSGDFMYRFGNPVNYGRGAGASFQNGGAHQMYGAHNIQWIGESQGSSYSGFSAFGQIPGEGNLLIFDNNCWNPEEHASNVLEWNPFIMDGDGNKSATYVDPPDAGYRAAGFDFGAFTGTGSVAVGGYNNQVIWRFNGGTGFYGYHISSAQRMPNGNTHVCEGTQSHFFEVTNKGVVTWEYYKPNTASGFGGGDPAWSGGSTFRSTKVPAGHPGIDGKDLTPQGNFRQMVLELKNTPNVSYELQKFLGVM